MSLKSFPGGVHPRDHKQFSAAAPVEEIPLPARAVIHLSQHIGSPSTPLVKVGDEVKTGQLIAEASGFVSIPQHASISGKISKIDRFYHPTGIKQVAIEITSDEKDEWVQLVDEADFMQLPPSEMKERVAAAGICGMGGAGFPTVVKLSPPDDKPIDTVILNGVECEPYLTADYRLMLERGEDIIQGLRLIMKMVDARRGIIGIEANKPDAIEHMQRLCANDPALEVVPLRLKYPQGAEKQLIYAATKRKVPNAGGLPSAVGVVVQNVATAVAIFEAIRFRKPLIERIISVTGRIVKNPKNLKARIGTPYSELVDFCGGLTEPAGKYISGGPMMGFAIPNLDAPVAKGSSGLVVFDTREAHDLEEKDCLRCARCVDVCPMDLMPSLLAMNVKAKNLDMAAKLGLNDCIKCGSCAYVCPAHIRLVQWIETGKVRWAEAQRNPK